MKTKTAKENLTLEWSYLYRCDVCLPGFHSWLVCKIPIRWRKGGELLNEKNKVLTVYSLPWRRYVQSFKPIRCTGVVVEPANGFRIPNWFHRWFSLVREGWWAAQVWERGARCGAKKLISLASTLLLKMSDVYNVRFRRKWYGFHYDMVWYIHIRVIFHSQDRYWLSLHVTVVLFFQSIVNFSKKNTNKTTNWEWW